MDENSAPHIEADAAAGGVESDGFHVGYDNGYGYRPDDWCAPTPIASARPVRVLRAPSDDAASRPVDPATQAFPLDGSLLQGPAAPTARYAAVAAGTDEVDPSFALTRVVRVDDVARAVAGVAHEAPQDRRRRSRPWVTRSLVLGALAFVVLAAALAVLLATRPATATFANASAASAAASSRPPGTVLDEHGNVIAGSITVVPEASTTVPEGPTTLAPILDTTSPATALPVGTPPVTTPPSTVAPTTTAPPAPPTTAAPTTTSTAAPTTTSTTLPQPKVLTFAHPGSVNCANPADPTPYIPISWTTQHAVKVTISIDGPGVYKSYLGANGSDTFPFSCPGPHTYRITAYSATNQVVAQQVVIAKA